MILVHCHLFSITLLVSLGHRSAQVQILQQLGPVSVAHQLGIVENVIAVVITSVKIRAVVEVPVVFVGGPLAEGIVPIEGVGDCVLIISVVSEVSVGPVRLVCPIWMMHIDWLRSHANWNDGGRKLGSIVEAVRVVDIAQRAGSAERIWGRLFGAHDRLIGDGTDHHLASHHPSC